MKLSIIIPCYNEEKNIPLILERFQSAMKDPSIEVILVNNGSTDNSAEVLANLLPRYSFARTVLVVKNQGYGYGILQGLRQADGDYLGWTHADMQTDPCDVIKAWEILRQTPNAFIKGNRKGRPLFDRFFTLGMSCFESVYLGVRLYDINAQPNLFPRSFFEGWRDPPHDFSLDLYAYFLARKRGLKIVRIPVLFPERQYGTSSWNTGLKAKWKFIKRTIAFSVELKKRGIS